jgi:cytochrome c-type biogenesis protein CcsB
MAFNSAISLLSLDKWPLDGCFCFFAATLLYWQACHFTLEGRPFQTLEDLNNPLTATRRAFLARAEAAKTGISATQAILFGNVFSGGFLFFRWIGEGYFPLSNLYESLLFLVWGISFIHLFIERTYLETAFLGSILAPILFILSAFATVVLPQEMQKAHPLLPSLQSDWLMMHVSCMLISYALLIVGSLFSILYLAIRSNEGLRKAVEPGDEPIRTYVTTTGIEVPESREKVFKISFLEILDTWSYRVIGVGFPFLTIGIIAGAVWANEAWGAYWSWDPKETWAFITWLVFAFYLHLRIVKGMQGKEVAFIGALGFLSLWICYLGVNFLGEGLHSYGFVYDSTFTYS